MILSRRSFLKVAGLSAVAVGHSDLYSNAPDKCKKAVQNQLNGAQLLSDIPGAKDVEVESANIGFALDKDGKETSTYVINAVLVKKKSNS